MKKTDLQELRKKPASDLHKLLSEKREKLNNLTFDLSSGKVNDINELKKTKQDIAQIMTIINEQNHA